MTQNDAFAERARRVLTPNYRQQPIAVVRGAGVRVWDADGREYLDFLGGVAVDVLGHCHPALVKALEEQARTLWHVSNHFYIARQVELAEALLARVPWARRAFFCNSGAEASELTRKAGALLCLDEIQTGMGRTGRWWAHEWEGVAPDLMSSAKALGGGFPMGALLATEEVGLHLTPGSHGTTFGGNPLACAVALAVVRELAEGVLERSLPVAERLRDGLAALAKTGRVTRVRGRGMLLGVVLDGVAASDVARLARERGLLVNPIGDDVIRVAPALTLTAAEADDAVARFAAALAAAP